MAKDRELACKYYVCEGECSKGREANFKGYCQKCNKYDANKKSRPRRTDRRNHKLNRINKKEFRKGDLD